VPLVWTRNTSGQRPSASGARPAPLKLVQHWPAGQPTGRPPRSHAAGGTRAPVAVARYSSHSTPSPPKPPGGAIPTERPQISFSAPLVWARLCANGTMSGSYATGLPSHIAVSPTPWLIASLIETITGSVPVRKPTPPRPVWFGGTFVGEG